MATTIYPTRADAEAAAPADVPGVRNSLRPFEVRQNGTSRGWVLARGHADAIEQVARLDGYTATTGPATRAVSGRVAKRVATLTDDQLAAMGLKRS